eukprot:6178856-Pleurochrysis_carterae.AAC.6
MGTTESFVRLYKDCSDVTEHIGTYRKSSLLSWGTSGEEIEIQDMDECHYLHHPGMFWYLVTRRPDNSASESTVCPCRVIRACPDPWRLGAPTTAPRSQRFALRRQGNWHFCASGSNQNDLKGHDKLVLGVAAAHHSMYLTAVKVEEAVSGGGSHQAAHRHRCAPLAHAISRRGAARSVQQTDLFLGKPD